MVSNETVHVNEGSSFGVKIKELRDKSEDELTQLLQELEEELFNLKSRKATGQLDKPHKFREVHKTIARIKTIFNERSR